MAKGEGLFYPQMQSWGVGGRGGGKGCHWAFQLLPWKPVGPEQPWMLAQGQQASPGPGPQALQSWPPGRGPVALGELGGRDAEV